MKILSNTKISLYDRFVFWLQYRVITDNEVLIIRKRKFFTLFEKQIAFKASISEDKSIITITPQLKDGDTIYVEIEDTEERHCTRLSDGSVIDTPTES